ncbi:uncharacterized protein LOC116936631 [Daphnia magna]|uniref:uncharacterized protein LOC116936631 n=1 Tax=Daphnia magna TaxID=35525 RepID=UPI001E1BB5B4|nr:uncharacterized protein LOC116936631 [Daphnia magna]
MNYFQGIACLSLATFFSLLAGINYLPKFIEFVYSPPANLVFKANPTFFSVNQRYFLDFERFDNETGANKFIVPNIIHYIRLNKKSWSFVEYICLRSAYVNQRPDFIFIHTNIFDGFKGKYWKWIQEEPDLKLRLIVVPVQLPSEIFGQKLNPVWRIHHGSDLIRIQALMKYGGIFLDNDVYVVRNLDKYRKFEMTLGWPRNESLGTMVLLANKNARFLPLWLDNYRDYKADQWYYNAGDNPTASVLMKHPELVHREPKRLGVHFMLREMFQESDNFPWYEKLDTVHLLINHRSYLDMFYKDYRYFNERNILHYPFNFGEMARLVLNRQPSGNYTVSIQQ